MHSKCYSDAARLIDDFQTVCPTQYNCTEVMQDGYAPTVQGVGPSVVAIVSCSLSVLGSLLIIYTYARWKDLRTGSRSIVTFLAIADLVTASGYIVGSANYIRHFREDGNTQQCATFNTVCQIQSFVTTTSSLCSFAWTSILAIYLYMVIVKTKIHLANKLIPLYHVIAWSLPLTITLPLLITGKLGYGRYAVSNWCFIKSALSQNDKSYFCGHLNYKTTLLVLFGGKLWELLTYAVIIVLYTAMKWHIHTEGRCDKFMSVSSVSAIKRIDKKLTFIPVIFILLRIWGTVQFFYSSGVAHLTYLGCAPKHFATGFTLLAYIQSIGDGGQGWGNVLLYVFASPKIRQRLLECPCHPSLVATDHNTSSIQESRPDSTTLPVDSESCRNENLQRPLIESDTSFIVQDTIN